MKKYTYFVIATPIGGEQGETVVTTNWAIYAWVRFLRYRLSMKTRYRNISISNNKYMYFYVEHPEKEEGK